MKRFSLRLPDEVHALLEDEVQRQWLRYPTPSMNDLIIMACQQVYGSGSKKEAAIMESLEFSWSNEQNPGWDSTGTIAESWSATHDKYHLRIDRFNAKDGGEFAYSVDVDGNYIQGGENEGAVDFEDAEDAIRTLLAR